jgi:hypothetical protein
VLVGWSVGWSSENISKIIQNFFEQRRLGFFKTYQKGYHRGQKVCIGATSLSDVTEE